jgi:C-methyltransferase C-terminal domain/Putative zinc binding domain/Methyltransferase domain
MSAMTVCRACTSDRMLLFLPLGPHPPANAFVRPDRLSQAHATFDLDTHVCLACGLIEVPNVIPPDFFRDYVYVPSASETMHAHFRGLAAALVTKLGVLPTDLVVDIGSNDGLFLSGWVRHGRRGLGIEPAVNLTEIARGRGVEVVNDYFTPALAADVRAKHGPATVIVTTNTFNHIDDLHDFMRGVTALLDDRGTFVVEVPHAGDLVTKNEFDTVYHEHVSEFSVKSLVDLYRFFDMEVVDIDRLPIHGGSMRVYARRRGVQTPTPVVEQWLASERDLRLFDAATYDAFRVRVEQNRTALMQMLRGWKAAGKRLAGYGAPAKGNTLLNYYGIGPDLLDYLADKNPLKHGLYSPGMHIPVVPAERVLETQPDYLLILAWNFADEIMQQQAEYRARGGRFVLPIPEPRVVG